MEILGKYPEVSANNPRSGWEPAHLDNKEEHEMAREIGFGSTEERRSITAENIMATIPTSTSFGNSDLAKDTEIAGASTKERDMATTAGGEADV